MTGPEDDAGARVRDIFEQLRSDGEAHPGDAAPDSDGQPETSGWNHGHRDEPEPAPDATQRGDDGGDDAWQGDQGDGGGGHEEHHEGGHAWQGDPGEQGDGGGGHEEHQEGGDAWQEDGGGDHKHHGHDQQPASWHADPSPHPHDEPAAERPAEAGSGEDGDGDVQLGVSAADAGADLAGDAVTPEPEPLPPRELPRIIAIANQKGGVGKTTTAVNLGASLAELGYRVLVVDLDPQGNATTGLGVNTRNLEHSVYDVILHDVPIEDCIEATSLRNLFVVPATIDLAGAEIELVPAFSREQRLRRALESVGDDFDFTVIDCPPSLGLLTVNGLTAATEVLVPIQCEYYALEGLGQLLRNVNLVQGNLNPRLELSTIILTMYDARTKLAEQVANEVREHFGDKVCRTMVPRTVRLSEAPSFGQPVILFDPTSRGAIAYRELAKEVSRGAPQRAR